MTWRPVCSSGAPAACRLPPAATTASQDNAQAWQLLDLSSIARLSQLVHLQALQERKRGASSTLALRPSFQLQRGLPDHVKRAGSAGSHRPVHALVWREPAPRSGVNHHNTYNRTAVL